MISNSALTIDWLPPDIEAERWEFFSHPAKQQWYHEHGSTWEQIVAASAHGRLVPYPRSACLEAVPVARSYDSYEEFQTYLARAKRGYRKSYTHMETALQEAGTLTLPAAIILVSNSQGLLFSGYRRLCLAWNYGMVPYVWLVTVPHHPAPL